jgi:hypothetical protein
MSGVPAGARPRGAPVAPIEAFGVAFADDRYWSFDVQGELDVTASPNDGPTGEIIAALTEGLAAGDREAFTALLTEDVRWGGEHGGGNECTDRAQAGEHYAELLAAGITLEVCDVQPAGTTTDGDVLLVAHLQVHSPDPENYPPMVAVRLTLRGALISDIRILDSPPTIEVLHVADCPHHEAFLPHLRELLTAHGITVPIALIRIDTDDDARAHRFLGSPTVRVNGHDVEPAAVEREIRNTANTDDASGLYGLQCRLYRTPTGATGVPSDEWIIDALVDNPTHTAAITAIHLGDLTTLRDLLAEHPDLATTRLIRHGGRTLLHVATDWPGHHPDAAATIAALVAAGADPNAPCLGEHPETPLHWAASSNDLEAIDALLDAGADINAPGAVIAGGTPMADATAFGNWAAARRLLDRGADTTLFEAAALGLIDRVHHHLDTQRPDTTTITSGFWGACHGGHITTATVLLNHGADINWVGYDDLTPLDAARRSEATDLTAWLEDHGATSATRSH